MFRFGFKGVIGSRALGPLLLFWYVRFIAIGHREVFGFIERDGCLVAL